MVTQHQVLDTVTETVFISSILHTLLPPWDFLNDFPRAQKYYKVLIYIIGYAAGNGRSAVYRDISTQNGQHPSPAVQRANGGTLK